MRQLPLRLFIGRGQCSTCHVEANVSKSEFVGIGAAFFVKPGVIDPGRHGGITALRASPHHLLGRHRQPLATAGQRRSARPGLR